MYCKKSCSPKVTNKMEPSKKGTNSKPIPHIPLPFKEVMADVLKVSPPPKAQAKNGKRKALSSYSSRSSVKYKEYVPPSAPFDSVVE